MFISVFLFFYTCIVYKNNRYHNFYLSEVLLSDTSHSIQHLWVDKSSLSKSIYMYIVIIAESLFFGMNLNGSPF